MSHKQNMSARFFAAAAAGALLAAGVAHGANAVVENAKDQCIIGEQANGYLGFVAGSSSDTELVREVRDINQQRKAIYADLAARNGVSIDVTAALTAEKLINEAEPGECVRLQNGEWVEV